MSTNLTPDKLETLDDGELRKACQVVLKRDIGPITDSTRELYKLAVKKALTGHPIAFESLPESNPEVSFESDRDASVSFDKVRNPSPKVLTPGPSSRISAKFSPPTRESVSSKPFTTIRRSFPSPSTELPPLRPPRAGQVVQPNNTFLRNTLIIGIGAVLIGLILAALLSE